MLDEYGVIMPRGILEDAENGLSDGFRELLRQSYQQFYELDQHVAWYEARLMGGNHIRANMAYRTRIGGYVY